MIAAAVPFSAVLDMLGHPFIRYGFAAGTAVALACGVVGYFLVLRAQVFTADALSHVAFTGTLAALAFGADSRLGLFVGSVAIAVVLGILGPRGRADDVIIGGVFAWVLGLGVLFLSIFTSTGATGNGAGGVNVLFGSIYGLDRRAAAWAVAIAMCVVLATLAIGRRLLFASLDEAVARSRGVFVTALGLVFLAIVGVTAAEAAQVVGALLLLGLMAGPPAAAMRLTDEPYRALSLSAAIAVGCVWGGLVLSYELPKAPPSFSIIACVAAAYIASALVSRISERRQAPPAAMRDVVAAEPM